MAQEFEAFGTLVDEQSKAALCNFSSAWSGALYWHPWAVACLCCTYIYTELDIFF